MILTNTAASVDTSSSPGLHANAQPSRPSGWTSTMTAYAPVGSYSRNDNLFTFAAKSIRSGSVRADSMEHARRLEGSSD